MKTLQRIIKKIDWKGFYYFSVGVISASLFNLSIILACMLGGFIGLLIAAIVINILDKNNDEK